MTELSRMRKVVLVATLITLLAGCGGGESQAPIDKYLGKWTFTLKNEGLHVVCPVTVVSEDDTSASYTSAPCERIGPQIPWPINMWGRISANGAVSGNMMSGTLNGETGSGRWTIVLETSGTWEAKR